jgi:NADPH:quinone reductase
MKVVTVTQFGGPERLEVTETSDPVPAAGECLIAIQACDVLFLDTMLRAGEGPQEMRPRLPWTPGSGIAGHVVAVGEDVSEEWIGRPVGAHTRRSGGYAELSAVPLDDVVPIPERVDVRTAAALLHDGPTALKLAQVTAISREARVLVLGASGGLGLALVQLARARARRVVAVARGEAKQKRIATLEPDAIVDPDRDDWVQLAREALGPDGATVILDNVGPPLGPAAFPLLAAGGHFSAHATHGGPFTELDRDRVRAQRAVVTGIEHVQMPPTELAELTGAAFAAAATGELRPTIGQTFPLERAAEAHSEIEARRVFGKTLLVTDGSTAAA